MNRITIIAITDNAIQKALELQKEFPKSTVVTTRKCEDERVSTVESVAEYVSQYFNKVDGICFIGALGICVRTIAPCIKDKGSDPAVICMDDQCQNVQSVIGGHQQGANDLAIQVARFFGATPVISTASDVQNIWPLDTLATKFGWTLGANASVSGKNNATAALSESMAKFVNNEPTALVIEVKDRGTEILERTKPDFVDIYYSWEGIDWSKYKLCIAVTFRNTLPPVPSVFYHPKCLHIGSGCSKELDFDVFKNTIEETFENLGLASESIAGLYSIDIKAQQQAYIDYAKQANINFSTYSPEEIENVKVPNPSPVVQSKIGVDGVSESTSMLASGNSRLILEKEKFHLPNDQKCTLAIALDNNFKRRASISIVGAGPGDSELITVKGRFLLESADCVLYAGSLIPETMTNWCKPGAIVRNSASMTLEEQIDLIKSEYTKGHSIVRLHSGDPSIYGAIQEQMTIFDELGFEYFIVPGISAFTAAAASLKSEFTIPEVVQTIIITRGEGKTPTPEAEKLEEMAKLRATLCLFLSVGIAKKIEEQLLQHYPSDTPVAVMYRLTWEDEEIWTGELSNLAQIVKDSKKTRTVLIIVGHAIGSRKNRSQLYHPDWKHIFRTNKKFKVELQ